MNHYIKLICASAVILASFVFSSDLSAKHHVKKKVHHTRSSRSSFSFNLNVNPFPQLIETYYAPQPAYQTVIVPSYPTTTIFQQSPGYCYTTQQFVSYPIYQQPVYPTYHPTVVYRSF